LARVLLAVSQEWEEVEVTAYRLEQVTRTPSAMPFCPVRFGDESLFDGLA